MTLLASALVPQRSRRSSDDNMIPLINIVFLLLIFFMVAGQMRAAHERALQLPTASSDAPVKPQQRKLVLRADGELLLDGVALDLQGLGQALAAATSPPAVLVLGDRGLSAQQLSPVLAMLIEHQVQQLQLATLAAAGD